MGFRLQEQPVSSLLTKLFKRENDTWTSTMDVTTMSALPVLYKDDRGSAFYRIVRCPSFAQEHNANPWISLVPPMPHNGRGFDITIDWSIDEDTTRVAKYIIEQCIQEIPKTMTCDCSSLRDARAIQRLACSLSSFRAFVSQELHLSSLANKSGGGLVGFKARINASRGSHGTRCPKWHVDHVPVRWIESLVGRGTEVIAASNGGVQWQSDSGYRLVVDSTLIDVHRATEGEAILLVGNRWNEFATDGMDILEPVQAAVHKSPAPIPVGEGRVTLTQDIMLEYDDEE
jgi:hypothetical protein